MGNGNLRRCAFLLPLAIVGALSSAALAQPTVTELRAIAQRDAEDVDAWINLGNAYLAQERFGLAKEAFLEAVALDYLNGDAHFGLGLSEFGRGDLEAALFAFNEVTRLHPERFDGHYNRGVTLSRLGRPGDAAEAFRAAIEQAQPEVLDGELIDAYVGLASQLSRAGDPAGAAEAYASAAEFVEVGTPDSDELLFLEAQALYRAGRGLEALPELTRIEAENRDERVSGLISDIYLDQGQVDYALRVLERGVRRAEEAGNGGLEAGLLVKLGLLQRQLGRDAEAAASFERAVSLDDSSWQALYNLGVSQLETGQPSAAVRTLERAAALDGAGGEVQLALASAYELGGRVAEAIASARAAAGALAGNDELVSQADLILGRSLYRSGDYAQAAAVLGQVVRARPSDPEAQLWAGLSSYQQGSFLEAAQYYERAVQLAPNSIEARSNLGAAYLAAERFGDAQAVYELLVQQNPQDAESFFNLAWSLMSQDRRAAARDAWQRAQELGHAAAGEAISTYF